MNKDGIILIADEDSEHFGIIKKSFAHAGLENQIISFTDGQQIINFLFNEQNLPKIDLKKEYLLLLDINIPKIDGLTVLKQIRSNPSVSNMPVIVLTSADEPEKIEQCHSLKCNMYIVRPKDHEEFIDTIDKIGCFLSVIEMPKVHKFEQKQE